jgi:cellulose synthase/poly-beta-1,6-N-acetylglucosamine synthase-like glycosyltransferase
VTSGGSPDIHLTVAVGTRNRPADIRECVRTILANPDQDFELVVVDQSDDAAGSLDEFAGDSRLRHHRTLFRGASRARNEVLALSRTDIVAFTDDDCRVPHDFVANVKRFFQSAPDVSLAFGRVVAPPELFEKGFVATFDPAEGRFEGAFPSPFTPWGIGANMALRIAAVTSVGAFDPCLGPGAIVPIGGEELDLAMRVIGAGLTVAHTQSFEVTHLGVREWAVSRAQFSGYSAGAGAAYMKNIRLRTPGVTKLFGAWLARQSFHVLSGAIRGRRPTGLGMMLATLRGSMDVLSLPLDRRKKAFAVTAAPK